MGTAKFDLEKFIDRNDFGLWRLKMRALLVQRGSKMPYLERKTCPLPCKKMRKQNRSQCHHSFFRWYGAERGGQSKVHNWVVAQARELIHDQVISKTITNVMDVSPHHIHIRALSLPLGSSSWISLRIIVDCLGRIGSFRIVVIHIFITIH